MCALQMMMTRQLVHWPQWLYIWYICPFVQLTYCIKVTTLPSRSTLFNRTMLMGAAKGNEWLMGGAIIPLPPKKKYGIFAFLFMYRSNYDIY